MKKESIKTEVKDGLITIKTNLTGKVLIDIQNLPLKRSDRQNRYYWGVVIPLVKSCLESAGYTLNLDDTHEVIKQQFNKKVIVSENGHEITLGQSTAKLSKDDFAVFIKKIESFTIENFNTPLPQPFENYENE